jgi:hypothetical protein
MDRREMIGMLGVGAVGMAALSGREAQGQAQSADHAKLDAIHKECLEACGDCAKTCDMTFHHCYVQVSEGKRDHAKPLHLVADCAGFCTLAARNIARHSPLMAYSCEACAEACKATLAEVSRFDSPEMKNAARSLAKCEKSCRAMVEAMGHGHHH